MSVRGCSISWVVLSALLFVGPTLRAEEETGADLSAKLPPVAEKQVDFIKDIQPIFAAACHDCHGPDLQEAGLRLDSRKNAFDGGDTGRVILKGESGKSPLIHLVARLDPEKAMPPEDTADPLTAEQVGLLRAWIDQGAVWPDSVATPEGDEPWKDHWSFQPITHPEVPAVKNDLWVRTPIDAFILHKLEEEGVEPSPEASRPTLIRRLSLDLLGLPPTAEEVDAFVYDERPDAYERLVERLLASPHFGERWGRHWLDLARYADSDGYEKDRPRPWAWRYRNWVIDAINADMPFDQFTIEQLAGDLLPNPTLDQKIATGFHRNTLTNTEGGTDQEEDRVKQVVDRVNTTGTVWLGLTVGCAQCHTHKYDPLRQREYYGLFAFFNSDKEVNLPAPLPDELAAYNQAKVKYDEALKPLQAALDKFAREQLQARQQAWEQKLAAAEQPLGWSILSPTGATSAGGATLAPQVDQSLLAKGVSPEKDIYTVVLNAHQKQITGLRLEVLADESLPNKSFGRDKEGRFTLSELTLTAAPTGQPTEAKTLTLHEATATAEEKDAAVKNVIDGKDETGWTIPAGDKSKRHVAYFQVKEPVEFKGPVTLTVTLKQLEGNNSTLGRVRLACTDVPAAEIGKLIPDDVLDLLTIAADRRQPEQQKRIDEYYRGIDAEYVKLSKAVQDQKSKEPKFPPTLAQTLAQNDEPRKNYLLIRGDFLRKGDEVEHHTPSFLHEFPEQKETPSRLDLANWLISPENPLTARVTINRIWKNLFGRAIVPTEADFGMRGDLPSHPQLFDWLASEMMAQGWSRKKMIRTIVHSATYRQSSAYRPELVSRDPANAWLARQNRFRLEAEVIRDSFLASSGLLSRKIGGPSVKPPLPADVAALGYANSVKWQESSGADRYRRGLYIFFQRTVPYPMLATFDAPESNVTCTRRERSNTPLQSLTLLNDPVFFETAQALGRRMVHEHPDDQSERIQAGFRWCLARRPTDVELTQLQSLYDEMRTLLQENEQAAAELVGDEKVPAEQRNEIAASVAVARIIMNLDEFVTRE